ncbi:MAG TPA: tRNA (guanosine(46)-N7)-methyltransferase TrmB [Chthoniobacterales bacterium]|nr:tRNA (guanosine(46)-N7)-methyltransferase TrmB [Chthoniobacterales bacterium]
MAPLPLIDVFPESAAETLNLAELFGRDAPVQVDLGCGDGSFLAQLAAERPDTNFLGIERLLHRVRSSHRKGADLPNVRIIRSETLFVLQHLLPAGSIEAFYLLFPDPWPKRRHHRRRVVTTAFLTAINNRLTSNGALFIATDDDDYFRAIQRLTSSGQHFAAVTSDWKLPATTFEKKFVASGVPIHRLELRKVSPVA